MAEQRTKWELLEEVYQAVEDNPHFAHLRTPGIRLVRGDGAATAETARVLVVGEAPGAVENGSGRPFAGRSGAVLNDLLKVAGLARDRVFVTNVVKYRPPGNRTPSGREVEDGRTALRAEWAIIAPRLTIAVGRPAQTALGLKESPHGIIGAWDRAGTALVVSVYHPAFGMRWKKARTWIENEWEQLAEGIKVYCPEVL